MKIPNIKPGSYLIIRTDGTEELVKKPATLKAIYAAIGSQVSDSVILDRDRQIVMIVDDEGYDTETVDHGGGRIEIKCVKARKPVNQKATELYHLRCKPGTTHQIVGDVAIINDQDFE